MNVINLSLGDDSNNPLDPRLSLLTTQCFLVLLQSLPLVTLDQIQQHSDRASPFAITVGASDSSISLPKLSGHAGQVQFPNLILFGKNFTDKIEDFKGQSLPIESVGIGTPDEFSTKDVKGKMLSLHAAQSHLMKRSRMRNKLVQKPLLFITMWMERFLSTLAKVQNTFQHSAYRKKTVKN